MTRFLDLTLNGLANGAVYAAVALSLVLIWRATRIVNFAQAGDVDVHDVRRVVGDRPRLVLLARLPAWRCSAGWSSARSSSAS